MAWHRVKFSTKIIYYSEYLNMQVDVSRSFWRQLDQFTYSYAANEMGVPSLSSED